MGDLNYNLSSKSKSKPLVDYMDLYCHHQTNAVNCRSYKSFNTEAYRNYVQCIPFSVIEVLNDPSDMVWA